MGFGVVDHSIRESCPGCGALLPVTRQLTHKYMVSSPACWGAFGTVMAREYQDPTLFAACHRQSVDAYAMQHFGNLDDPRQVRSVWVHLARQHAVITLGPEAVDLNALMQALSGLDFPTPPHPARPPTITVVDVLENPRDHVAAAHSWARDAHAMWEPLHEPVSALLRDHGIFRSHQGA
jgi:hypothetical protein